MEFFLYESPTNFVFTSHNSQIFTFFADFAVVMFCSNCLGIEQGIQKKRILTNYILLTGQLSKA